MSTLLTNLSIIQKLSNQLLKPKKLNYSEQCIPYYVNDNQFIVQELQEIQGAAGQKIKNSFIRHRMPARDKGSPSYSSIKLNGSRDGLNSKHNQPINSKCIVFLHGLGSSRLEPLPMVQCLPTEYCLFTYDSCGSGKSEGDNITYGKRQSEDLGAVIDQLKKKGLKEFVIWGRSMGAVAALLYTLQLNNYSKVSIEAAERKKKITSLVIDSPFSNFRSITKQIAIKRLGVNIPEFLIDFTLNYISQNFQRSLKQAAGSPSYNPFSIQFDKEQNIQTQIPTVFLYSESDEVVSSTHSEKIIKNYRSIYERVILPHCTHNQVRPKQSIKTVFQILNKFGNWNSMLGKGRYSFQQRHKSINRDDTNISHYESRISSTESSLGFIERKKSKGISVTASQQKRKQKKRISSNQTLKPRSINKESYSSLKIEPKLHVDSSSEIDINNDLQQLKQQKFTTVKKYLLNHHNNKANQYLQTNTLETQSDFIRMKLNDCNPAESNDGNTLKAMLNHTCDSRNMMRENLVNLNRSVYKGRKNNRVKRIIQGQLNHTKYL